MVVLDILAVVWLLVCWIGYSFFAKAKAKHTPCLASVLHLYRKDWWSTLMCRENRVGDSALIAILDRNVTFFASTTMLVLAGLLTVLAASERVYSLLSSLPFVSITSPQMIQLKLLVLVMIFIYAFFTFTWSIRQYQMGVILLGAAPAADDVSISEEKRVAYAKSAAKVLDRAGHSYNFGLRSYYFALATLAWFISPVVEMIAITLVLVVLYQREFRSRTLMAMLSGRRFIDDGTEV